jgi:hypothetical protein
MGVGSVHGEMGLIVLVWISAVLNSRPAELGHVHEGGTFDSGPDQAAL